MHLGIDITDPAGAGLILGAPVLAVTNGEVVAITTDSSRPQGYHISIRATDPALRDPYTQHHLIFTHMHLRHRPTLTEGAIVHRGDVIGFVGRTGSVNSDGHLHFEVANSNATWGPDDRVTRRINPVFFYPAGSFQGTTTIWNERR